MVSEQLFHIRGDLAKILEIALQNILKIEPIQKAY